MVLRGVFIVLLVLTGSGCAVHYFDVTKNTEHVWGIGHMAMKPSAPNGELKAVGRRTDVVGISIGRSQEEAHLDVGWGARQRIDIVDKNTQLCLAWPRGSFYNARIGSEFPPSLDTCEITPSKEKKQ